MKFYPKIKENVNNLNLKEFKLKPDEAINEIIRFSTLPGTSRHHWGTEIDIIDEEFNINPDPLQ